MASVPLGRGRCQSAACTPLQGSCGVKPSGGVRSLLSSEACQGAGRHKSDSKLSSEKSAPTPVTKRRFASLGPTIRALVRECGEQDKKLQALDEDYVKTEAKLSAAVQEKTSLSATVACLKKQLLELKRSNELLKSKLSEDGVQKKMSSLCMELMKLRNMRDAKEKTALAKQENVEMKLQEVQRNLEHSKGKVAQLEEKLSATEREKVIEKSDTEKLLEYITELSSVAETAEKYKVAIAQMEETLIKKDQDIEILRDTLKTKEESCKLMKELHELQQEKELSAAAQQKLLELQDEVTRERRILEEVRNDTMTSQMHFSPFP
ncbi:hyaluronan mediated motility receptor-like [Pseudopipra pipra]|uniref:hyaluronan mediated motility receptor-like n=1 Tax=Pseudopipra pipra TaxID=415032 RepID=UPI003138C884